MSGLRTLAGVAAYECMCNASPPTIVQTPRWEYADGALVGIEGGKRESVVIDCGGKALLGSVGVLEAVVGGVIL